MGSKHSNTKYSFQDQFDILNNGPFNAGIYKLQDHATRQTFIGRELSCNDYNQAYEIECIIDEKINHPSPFVTKLLRYQSEYSETYCSNTNKFYLLFKDIPRLLSDQIKDRQATGRYFMIEEIDAVINRVAKGIKYLYDIYHHHGAISSRAITWPININPKQSIQLVDQWVFNTDMKQSKYKNLRPKDQQQLQQKNIEKAMDLYNLGQVAKEMLQIGNGSNILAGQSGYSNVINKIQVLTSGNYQDRNLIYNMIGNIGMDMRPTFETVNSNINNNVMRTGYSQNDMYSYNHQQNTFNYSTTNQQPTNYYTFSNQQYKQSYMQPNGNISTQFSNPKSVIPASQKNSQVGNSYSFINRPVSQSTLYQTNQFIKVENQRFTNFENKNINTGIRGISPQVQNRNASSSTAKVSFNNGISQNYNRNASVGKINTMPSLNIKPAIMNSSSSNANLAIPPKSFPNNNSFSININDSSKNVLGTSNITSSQPLLPKNQTNSGIHIKPTVQFNQSNSISSSINNLSIQPRTSETTFLSQSNSTYLPPNINIKNNSSLGGFNYSFGQSSGSNQTFSFKGPSQSSNSNSDEGLFTSADFFKKLNQSANPQRTHLVVDQFPTSTFQVPLITSIAPSNNTNSITNNQYSYDYSSSITSNLNKDNLKIVINHPQNIGSSVNTINQLPTSPATSNFVTTNTVQNEKLYNYSKINPTQSIQEQFNKIASDNGYYNNNQKNKEVSFNEKQLSKEYEYEKYTPAKNTSKANQPFSTIPEVSQRSVSVRSDDDKDYVIEQYENGSRYEGYKANGMRNGRGRFYYQEGSFYDGEWKNNNMHGYGKLYYSNQKLAYEGEWFIDQFHGKGKVYNDEPTQIFGFFDYTNFQNLEQKWKYYEGDLVCDSKEGDGKLVLSNDQYYQGQFKNDKVDGRGKFVTKNGEVISGIWQDSRLIKKF